MKISITQISTSLIVLLLISFGCVSDGSSSRTSSISGSSADVEAAKLAYATYISAIRQHDFNTARSVCTGRMREYIDDDENMHRDYPDTFKFYENLEHDIGKIMATLTVEFEDGKAIITSSSNPLWPIKAVKEGGEWKLTMD